LKPETTFSTVLCLHGATLILVPTDANHASIVILQMITMTIQFAMITTTAMMDTTFINSIQMEMDMETFVTTVPIISIPLNLLEILQHVDVRLELETVTTMEPVKPTQPQTQITADHVVINVSTKTIASTDNVSTVCLQKSVATQSQHVTIQRPILFIVEGATTSVGITPIALRVLATVLVALETVTMISTQMDVKPTQITIETIVVCVAISVTLD